MTILIGAEDADFGIQFGLGGGARFVTVGRFYEERIQIFYRHLPGGGKNGKNLFFAELLLCFREETFFNIGIGKNKVSKLFIRHAGVGDEPIFTDGIENGILQGGIGILFIADEAHGVMRHDLRIGGEDDTAGDVGKVTGVGDALAPVIRFAFICVTDEQKSDIKLPGKRDKPVKHLTGLLTGGHGGTAGIESLDGVKHTDGGTLGIDDLFQIRRGKSEPGEMININGGDVTHICPVKRKGMPETFGSGVFLGEEKTGAVQAGIKNPAGGRIECAEMRGDGRSGIRIIEHG